MKRPSLWLSFLLSFPMIVPSYSTDNDLKNRPIRRQIATPMDRVRNAIVPAIGTSLTSEFKSNLEKTKSTITSYIDILDSQQLDELQNDLKEKFLTSLKNTTSIPKEEEEYKRIFEGFLHDVFPSQEMAKEMDIDRDYIKFLFKFFKSYVERYNEKKINPMDFLTTQSPLNTPHPTFLPGRYDSPATNNGYWFEPTPWREEDNASHVQGWKIHVTAMPHSAQKIAELILPAINRLPSQTSRAVSYKIVRSIPLMRTLWANAYIKGSETQPGKFLVLYPDNGDHAYELVKKIDTILTNAIEEGILTKSDFLPLIGDAKVGNSGGVYVRYGAYLSDHIEKRTPQGEPMGDNSGTNAEYVKDDRFHPWPDFMNKSNQAWSTSESPFHELPLYWSSSSNPKDKITSWNDRPSSWESVEQNTQR